MRGPIAWSQPQSVRHRTSQDDPEARTPRKNANPTKCSKRQKIAPEGPSVWRLPRAIRGGNTWPRCHTGSTRTDARCRLETGATPTHQPTTRRASVDRPQCRNSLEATHIGCGISDDLESLLRPLLHRVATTKHIPNHHSKFIALRWGVQKEAKMQQFKKVMRGLSPDLTTSDESPDLP